MLKKLLTLFFVLVTLTSCTSIRDQAIKIRILADKKEYTVDILPGQTVQNALQVASLAMGALDRVDPPLTTTLLEPRDIHLVRVQEKFEVEDKAVSFENRKVHNESLPEGQTILLQQGVEGAQQITYRIVSEDGQEVSRTVVKTVVTREPMPEIIMVGVQTPFTAVPVKGKLAYVTSGNAWIMENSTGNRRPVASYGDLDGQVFEVSPDENWLLFTRKAKEDVKDEINSLWVVSLDDSNPLPMDLQVKNVVNFAGWKPGAENTLAYTTVEPRSTPPGWQANNDLWVMTFDSTGKNIQKEKIVDTNQGGVYGWWGTVYAWSPDGEQMAFARADRVGLVDLKNGKQTSLLEVTPLQTGKSWAWVPSLGWSPDSRLIYTVNHLPSQGPESDETSPLFDVAVVDPNQDLPLINLGLQTGMFAYPVLSPQMDSSHGMLAFLQAVSYEQSETSRYRLLAAQQDGSNLVELFPPEGSLGLDPQHVVWNPKASSPEDLWLAFVYKNNLWLLNVTTQQTQQITGDGTVTRVDWK